MNIDEIKKLNRDIYEYLSNFVDTPEYTEVTSLTSLFYGSLTSIITCNYIRESIKNVSIENKSINHLYHRLYATMRLYFIDTTTDIKSYNLFHKCLEDLLKVDVKGIKEGYSIGRKIIEGYKARSTKYNTTVVNSFILDINDFVLLDYVDKNILISFIEDVSSGYINSDIMDAIMYGDMELLKTYHREVSIVKNIIYKEAT